MEFHLVAAKSPIDDVNSVDAFRQRVLEDVQHYLGEACENASCDVQWSLQAHEADRGFKASLSPEDSNAFAKVLATSFDVHTTFPSESNPVPTLSLEVTSSTHVALGAGLVPRDNNAEIVQSPSARLLSQAAQAAEVPMEFHLVEVKSSVDDVNSVDGLHKRALEDVQHHLGKTCEHASCCAQWSLQAHEADRDFKAFLSSGDSNAFDKVLATSFHMHTTSPSESSPAATPSLGVISSTHVASGAGLVPRGNNEEIVESLSARLSSQAAQDAEVPMEFHLVEVKSSVSDVNLVDAVHKRDLEDVQHHLGKACENASCDAQWNLQAHETDRGFEASLSSGDSNTFAKVLAMSFDVHTTSPSESSFAATSSSEAISSTHVAPGAGLVPQCNNKEMVESPSARLFGVTVAILVPRALATARTNCVYS